VGSLVAVRFIALMLLTKASGGAAAEWVRVDGNDSLDSYADPATIRRSGNKVTMWDLLDYKTAQVSSTSARYLSAKVQAEYDCKEERVRQLFYSFHSGNKESGGIVYTSNKPFDWESLSPASIGETLWKVACGKR
jgi:hypothetical protein